MSWPVITYNSIDYYNFDGQVLIPVDPSTGIAQLLLKPNGFAVGTGIPAIEDGAPGATPTLDTAITTIPLAWDDPTADSASWTETSPDTYKLTQTSRQGEPGADGTMVLDVDDYGTPVYKKILQVDAAATGFEYASQRVGDRWIPASINNTSSGNPNSTLAVVSIPSNTYDFDWRPHVEAYTVVTGEAADVRVDLIARLNGETGGNIVGRCTGIAQTERQTIVSAPPAGSADAYDKVLANAAATIHLRTERQSGSVTYTTSATTTLFSVRAQPIP